jgi:septal ring factor EnvC (AmiA/AmiB activator)
VDGWIQNQEPGWERIAVLRRALSESQVLVYLGFAGEDTAAELEASLAELRGKRDETERTLAGLMQRRQAMGRAAPPAAPAPDEASASGGRAVDAFEVEALDREIELAKSRLQRQEKQIAARTDALPLFRATVGTEDLVDEMRARRDHPVHTLLRRMHHETRR